MKKAKPYHLLFGLVLLAGCRTELKKPGLLIVPPTRLLPDVKLDSTYTIAFQLINNGGANLLIDTVTASCGCSVPTIDRKQLPPRDTALLLVSFKPPDTGAFDKKIVIKSNIDSLFSIVSFTGTAKK